MALIVTVCLYVLFAECIGPETFDVSPLRRTPARNGYLSILLII